MLHLTSHHFAPVTFVVALTSIWSAAAAAAPLRICGSYNGSEKAVIIDVSSGCVSGSFRYKNHSVKAEIDELTATIRVSGKFNFTRPKGNAIPRDCMGQRLVKLELKGAQPRRYRVTTDRGVAGILDLTANHQRTCVTRRRGIGVVHPAFVRNLAAELLHVRTGKTIQDVIAPLMKQVTVAHEGPGSLSLNIYKPGSKGTVNRAVVEIKALDLADDSVTGLHFTVDLWSNGQSWKAVSLRRRSLCARGTQAGQWTDGKCS